MNSTVEAIGYGLVVAFLYAVWPPLALLGAGLLLVAWANVRAAKPAASRGRTAAAIGAAIGAARRAYRQQTGTEQGLRSVA